MLKKVLTAALTVTGMAALGTAAYAQEAQYSDIDTYINNYPISAYAVDGKMAVVAEDLRDYGFDVVWDGASRALHITRNNTVTQLTRKDIYKPNYPSGTFFSDIYQSDIRVDYNGTELQSYALNGYTLIPINDFAAAAGSEEWLGDIRAYKVWINDGLSVCEYMPLTQRCVNLWYMTDYNSPMPDIDMWVDVNSDGQYENVKLSSSNIGEWGDLSARLTVGLASSGDFLNDMQAYAISAVYLMDIVPNDGAKEIAIFSLCYSDDPMVMIFRCNGSSVKAIKFDTWDKWEGKSVKEPDFWLGYADAFPFTLHDDGSFTLQTQTESWGMWDIYTTYKINWEGNIVLIPQDYYEVVPSTWSYGVNNYGYYPVNQTLTGRGVNIYKREYIKPIYDDNKDHIYIRKNNGSEGWLTIEHTSDYYSGNISPMFMMAG